MPDSRMRSQRPVLSRPLHCIASLALAFGVLAQPVWAETTAPAPAVASTPNTTGLIETVSDLSTIPAPAVNARAWLTLDVNSDQIIASHLPDTRVEPASLTKLMAAYVIFDALHQKRLTLQDTVLVSEKAWKTEGSRMFINVNTRVPVDELLYGMIVQSGNDATVALAEAVAGSETAFVALMNEQAQRQGLTQTHFTNASGLPDEQHYTTVRDLAILSRNLIREFPESLHYYSSKEYTYNKIKQPNRNRLLWLDETVDGLKTGHTSSAGYCLVSTALRDGRRVISVLVGADSDAARAESSLKLLNWSFQNFDTVKLFDDAKPAVQARVWEGTQPSVDLGQPEAMWITVPRGKAGEIQPIAQYTQPLVAPLEKGTQVGTVTLTLDGQPVRQAPLTILQDVPQAGFFSRMTDKARRLFD